MILETDDFLEHYGVRGMHWGVRKDRKKSSKSDQKHQLDKKPSKSDQKHHLDKKSAGIILGSAVAAAAIGGGIIFAHQYMGLQLKNLSGVTKPAEQFTKAMAEEPLGIIHSARGRNVGFMFPQRGGLSDPLHEYNLGFGGDDHSHTFFRRYGDNLEKVAVRFPDPLGRKDHAGRIIPHDVLLPESLAKGVSNANDAEKVAWPRIKDVFGALYESQYGQYGPGF